MCSCSVPTTNPLGRTAHTHTLTCACGVTNIVCAGAALIRSAAAWRARVLRALLAASRGWDGIHARQQAQHAQLELRVDGVGVATMYAAAHRERKDARVLMRSVPLPGVSRPAGFAISSCQNLTGWRSACMPATTPWQVRDWAACVPWHGKMQPQCCPLSDFGPLLCSNNNNSQEPPTAN